MPTSKNQKKNILNWITFYKEILFQKKAYPNDYNTQNNVKELQSFKRSIVFLYYCKTTKSRLNQIELSQLQKKNSTPVVVYF